VNPGQPVYALGSPLFDRATIHLENARDFTVEAERSGPRDLYVQSVTWNGAPIERPWIAHNDLMKGGVLRFRLGPEPNLQWGAGGILTE